MRKSQQYWFLPLFTLLIQFMIACSGNDGQSAVFLRKDNFLKTDYYELMTIPAAKENDINNLIVKYTQEVKNGVLQKAEIKFIVSVNPNAPDLRKKNYLIINGQQYNLNFSKVERKNYSEVYSTERLDVLGRNYSVMGSGGRFRHGTVYGGTTTEVQSNSYDNCIGSVSIDETFIKQLSTARYINFRIYLGNNAYEYQYEFYDIAAVKRFANRESDETLEQ